MKIGKALLILSLVGIFQITSAQSEKTADPVLYITFINDAGEERTKTLNEVGVSDLSDSVKFAEFRNGDMPVLVEGIVVYVPKKGGLMPYTKFNNPEDLVRIMNSFTDVFVPTAGDKLIFDTLTEVESKNMLNSIVYTLE